MRSFIFDSRQQLELLCVHAYNWLIGCARLLYRYIVRSFVYFDVVCLSSTVFHVPNHTYIDPSVVVYLWLHVHFEAVAALLVLRLVYLVCRR